MIPNSSTSNFKQSLRIAVKIGFFLPILIFFALAYCEVSRLHNSYQTKKAALDRDSKKIELLAFGSSHGYYGFDPEHLKCMDSFNLANASQSLVLDSKILKDYIPKTPNLKAVVFFISYFSFETLTTSSGEPWRNVFYIRFYNISETEAGWYQFSSYLQMLSSSSKELLSQMVSRKGPDPKLMNDGYYKEEKDGSALGLISDRSGQDRVKIHEKYMDEKNINISMKELETAFDALPATTRIYLVRSPVLPTYQKFTNPQAWQRVEDSIRLIKAHYTNVTVVNAPEHLLSESDFLNNDHLNARGAGKFTDYLNGIICNSQASLN